MDTVQQYYSLPEVVKMTGIVYYRIYYAMYAGKIPQPQKAGKARLYTMADIENIRKHFAEVK